MPLKNKNYNDEFSRIVASDCVPRWKPEAEYLRFIHGFVQSAPQLLLQSVILLKGIHIHSLHDVIEAIQLSLRTSEEGGSVIGAVTSLISTKPLRWYWGLIQVSFFKLSFQLRFCNVDIFFLSIITLQSFTFKAIFLQRYVIFITLLHLLNFHIY